VIACLETTAGIPSAGSGPMSECEEPSLANGSVILFQSIPIGLGTNKNWILLHAASFTRDCW